MLFHDGLWEQYTEDDPTTTANFDFTGLLEGQIPYLESADLAVCHMETPLAETGGPYSGYPIFSIPPEIAQDARSVGYDVCTQASNHSVDQGTEGILRSIDTLEAAGLEHTGIYRTEEESEGVLIYDTPTARIAVINGTFSLNGLSAEYDWQVDGIDVDTLIAKAQQARAEGADIVIAGLHVGTEYQSTPNSQQVSVDRALVDSGEFDFVYNHHSHSPQPLEYYNGTWIAYSLGNNVSESSDLYRVNNEFLMVRIQFAWDEDAQEWTTSDMAWVPAVNTQDGGYKWCSVASDSPQGVCVSEASDAESRSRVETVVNSWGAAEAGAHELLITQE